MATACLFAEGVASPACGQKGGAVLSSLIPGPWASGAYMCSGCPPSKEITRAREAE